jgi:hypothetical protein
MKLDKFFFCELLRQEVGGTFTVIGLFANDELTLHGPR